MQGSRRNYSFFDFRTIAGLLFLITAAVQTADAQKYFFERYSSKEGLSASKVYTMIQDANDFVWLGTGSGVTRFDGTQFENFTSSNGLAPGGVKSILEDSRGRLWLGHMGGGLTIFGGDKFQRASFSESVFSGIDSLTSSGTEAGFFNVNGDITGIREFDGYIWIATSLGGALRIDNPEPGVTVLSGKQYLGREGLSNDAFGFYTGRSGNLYCITDVGIRKYNYSTDRFDLYSPPGLTKYFLTIMMFEDSRGNMWFGTHNGGLYRLSGKTGEITIYDD